MTATVIAQTPLTHQQEMRAAHDRLFAGVDQPDEWAHQASGLPDWTRAHVVAHLLGNARGLRRLTHWAASGTSTPMYDSLEARAAEIDEKAEWPLARLRTELVAESERLVSEIEALSHPLGARSLVLGSGAEFDAWELPMIRTREVEIHHVDLAAGYTADSWSEPFSFRTMNQVVPTFIARGTLPGSALIATDTGRVWSPGHSGFAETGSEGSEQRPEIVGKQSQLLAWLIGRPHHGLHCRDGSQVPAAPRWV